MLYKNIVPAIFKFSSPSLKSKTTFRKALISEDLSCNLKNNCFVQLWFKPEFVSHSKYFFIMIRKMRQSASIVFFSHIMSWHNCSYLGRFHLFASLDTAYTFYHCKMASCEFHMTAAKVTPWCCKSEIECLERAVALLTNPSIMIAEIMLLCRFTS